jgi:hypothetical protein
MLGVDGIVGAETTWALDHPGAETNLYTAPGWRYDLTNVDAQNGMIIQRAVGEIGNCEDPDGSNRGPKIDKYGQNGQPWCAYFLSWCFRVVPGGSPFGVKASALSLQTWARDNKRLVADGDVIRPGDIGIIIRASGHGHVEMVVMNMCAGLLSLCAGNVSNAVRGTVRQQTAFTCFARPIIL